MVVVRDIGLYELMSFESLFGFNIGFIMDVFQLIGITFVENEVLIRLSRKFIMLSGDFLIKLNGMSSHPGVDLTLTLLSVLFISHLVKGWFKIIKSLFNKTLPVFKLISSKR